MKDRARIFLDRFTEFEDEIAKIAKRDKSQSVTSNFKELCRHKPGFSRYQKDVSRIIDLRNMLVHRRDQQGNYLAEPTDAVIEILGGLIRLLSDPPLIRRHFQPEIREFSADDDVKSVLRYLTTRDFSQAIVRVDGKLNVLSPNTFQRWIARHLDDGIMELTAKVSDMLAFQETGDEIGFLDRKTSVMDALDYFSDQANLHALVLVVTENGRPDQQVLGLVTHWDLGKINKMIEAA